MPVQAQSADGTIHEFPDGTAPAVIDGAMKQYAASAKTPTGPDQTTWYQRLGHGAADTVYGLTQLMARGGAQDAGAGLLMAGMDPEKMRTEGIKATDELVANRERDYQAQRGQNAGSFDPLRMTGNIASTLPIAAIPGGAATTIPRMIGQGALSGGLTAATQPVAEGDFGAEKLKQIGMGAALGGATSGVIGGLSRVVSPNVSPEVQTLMDAGVTPTPGQLGGKGGRTIERITEHIPLVGNMPISAEQRTLGQYNLQTANQVLKPLGEALPDGVKAGHEAVEATKGILNRAFDDAYSRLSARATPEFVQSIGTIGADVPESMSREFAKRVTSQFGNLNPAEEMSGRTLSAARKYFEDLAVKYGRDPGAEQQLLGAAYSKVAGAIDDMVSAAHPEERALDGARAAWRMFLPFRSAAAKDVADGVFSPAQLAASVRQFAGNSLTSEGKAPLQDWAAAGLKVMGPHAPRSQSVTSTMLGGAGALYALPHLLQPGVAIPAVGVGAMYSPLGQRLTAAALTQRPAYARAIADALRSAAPYAATMPGAMQ